MSKANEREDDIERLLHDGRVHRWTRRRPAWPGHTTFVALKGGQVVLGDRYAGEGIDRTYACDPASLMEGTFQDLIRDQLGAEVLAEVLAEVRRDIGDAPAAPPPPAPPPPPPASPSVALPAPVKRAIDPVVRDARQAPPRVDVVVVTCDAIGLPLVVTLRAITRSPVKELLSGLRSLPFHAVKGVSRDHAEALAARLGDLGAEIQILPAA